MFNGFLESVVKLAGLVTGHELEAEFPLVDLPMVERWHDLAVIDVFRQLTMQAHLEQEKAHEFTLMTSDTIPYHTIPLVPSR